MKSSALRQQFPDEPWKWNKKWSDGVIVYSSRGAAVAVWVFTLFWNAISTPLAVMFFRHPPKHDGPPIALVLIFPVVGVLLAFAAIVSTMRALRFGRSELTLNPFPARPGEPMNASLRVHASLRTATDITAKLQCVRKEQSGRGDSQSTFEHILWEDDQQPTVEADYSDTQLKASFSPQAGAQVSDDSNPRNVFFWRLIVRAKMPGPDYQSTFVLPMFARATGDTTPPVRPFVQRSASAAATTGLPVEELAKQRIRVQRLSARSFSLEFPAARRIGTAMIISMFALLLDGVPVFLIRMSDGRSTFSNGFTVISGLFSLMFIVVFGLFGLLLTLIALSMWLVRTTATAERSGLTVVRHVLGITRRRTIASASVTNVQPKQTMSSGDRVFYSINATTDDGKTFTFGSGIEGRHIADRLAAAILDTVRPGQTVAIANDLAANGAL